MENYHQPIVSYNFHFLIFVIFKAMVKFNSLPKNSIVMVECRAYAKNIQQEVDSRLGMVTFELLLKDLESSAS